ncbi:NAD-dependent DNA ligase [Deferribacter autotrophicus]|uniref:NAD-dependent DNA ligase n=1 Tax=Deferribacter autotrophicus TaxID=500465 RepID=A0A5A8F1J4_9BACT|nr:BRCT domain-containing protein [Deferribacter autotrophicus]KAA0257562.1 NAD-dependent DNA ligase [Deferribacter autotrophicus]
MNRKVDFITDRVFNFCLSDVVDRQVDELIGLCKGVIADRVITESEAKYILKWLENNKESLNMYPNNIIYDRLSVMFADGVLDEEEKKDLLNLLADITGERVDSDYSLHNLSARLPYTNPLPEIEYEGRVFCFTGQLASMPRSKAAKIVEQKGGIFKKDFSKQVNYLVVGIISNPNWKHSTHGRKIEKALTYINNEGLDIKIIPEEHWIRFI